MLSALISGMLLGGCGGGEVGNSALMSGTAAVGAPLVGAAVRLRCADGSVLDTTTNALGNWQMVFSNRPLPCALQVSNGTLGGAPNSTAYHSVATTFGLQNITPYTSLVLARLVGASPQTWFNSPDFSVVSSANLQTAQDTVRSDLGLRVSLRPGESISQPYIVDGNNYMVRLLVLLQVTLVHPAVNKSYAQLLNSVVAGDLPTEFPTFAATFASESARLFPD